jgi:O-antigen/teichoic acid export membrane protein
MAWRGAGYWAIVALPLITNAARMILSWLGIRWIPGLPRFDAKVRSMVAFGGSVATSYIIGILNRSVDGILIGWRWGAVPLGLYSRAYNLLMLPVRQLGAPVGNVLVPAFSRVQEDPERFARYYLRAVNLIAWIGTPVFGYLFVAAEPVIVIVLGKQWREAAPVFQILAISALAQMLVDMNVWSLVSRGLSNRLLKLLLITSPIIIGSFAIGLPFGIKGVALSGSLVLVGIFPWILKFTFRGTQLTLQRFGEAIMCPTILCIAGVLSAELALHLIAPQRTVSRALVAALGFALAYLLSALIPRIRKEIMSFKDLAGELGVFRQPSKDSGTIGLS